MLCVLACAAMGSLAAGCGGSSPAAASSSTSNAAAGYARAISLHAGDVHGMILVSPETENARARLADELTQCGGGIPTIEAGGIHAILSRGHGPEMEQIESGVRVVQSAAIADRRLRANLSARVRACFARVFTAAQPAAPGTHVAVTALSSPLPHVGGSFGLRLTYAAGRGRLIQDILGFASGPVEVALSATRFSRPVSSAVEHRALLLLYGRAKASS
jgi:hypothetical protein